MPPSGHSLLRGTRKVHSITQQEPLLGMFPDSAFIKPSARGTASPVHTRDSPSASESGQSVWIRAGSSAKSKAFPHAKVFPVSSTRFLA